MKAPNTGKTSPVVTVRCSDGWQAKAEKAAAEFLGRLEA